MSTYRESASRPFYTIDSDNDTELLAWLYDLYMFRNSDKDELRRIEKQTLNLALYLNYSPANHKVFAVNASGSIRIFDKRDYISLMEPLIKDIVNQWVSTLTSRKPSFTLSPKNYSDPLVKSRADKAKAVIEAKFQEQLSLEMDEMNLRNTMIFGESYLEVLWDPTIGPLDKDIIAYLDSKPVSEDDEYEAVEKFAEQIRIGDVAFKLRDPRNTVVQRAPSYKDSEWIMFVDLMSTDMLKARYTDLEDKIQETTNSRVYTYDALSTYQGRGQTLVFKFYHRPTLEVPEGCIIEATPDVILSKKIYPSKKWIRNARFPILQAADLSILGSSRGAASTIMDACVNMQMALHSLWVQALTNLAMYTPKLLIQKGPIDPNQARVTDRSILYYGKSQAKPEMLVQEVVSQSHMLLIDKLRDRILKTASVSPPSVGDTIPNAESRKMLDFYKDQENLSRVPKDTQHSRFLREWATLTLELMSDKYDNDNARKIQYFGKQKKFNEMDIKGIDLDVDVDIYIDNISALSGTLDGRLQKIQNILAVPGMANYYTPAEIVDILDIGSVDKVIDDVTGAVETARRELHDILLGKDVPSPTKTRDIVTTYDVFMQEIQKPEIQEILPEIYKPGIKTIGGKLLDQVATLEMMLLEILKTPGGQIFTKSGPVDTTVGDMPIFAPQFGIPSGVSLRQYLYGRHPTFPSVYQPDAVPTINPFDVQAQAAQQAAAGSNGGMSPPAPGMMASPPMAGPNPQQGVPLNG